MVAEVSLGGGVTIRHGGVPASSAKRITSHGRDQRSKWAATFNTLINSGLRRKLNPGEYLHWLFTKLPTISAPNAGHFTPAAPSTPQYTVPTHSHYSSF